MANHSKNRGHRSRIEIDWKEFDKLCFMQCSELEIATWFNCGISTIEVRVKEQYGISFQEYFKRKRVGGLISLRRNMFKLSESHPQMAIFLAKNWLGMSDKQEIEHSGSISRRLEEYSTEELLAIIEGGARTPKA